MSTKAIHEKIRDFIHQMNYAPFELIWIKGLRFKAQPVSYISEKMVDIGKNKEKHMFDITTTMAMSQRFTCDANSIIKRFDFGGEKSFIFCVPSNQIRQITEPEKYNWAYWKKIKQLNKEEVKLPNLLGKAKTVLYLENPRAPTLKINKNHTYEIRYLDRDGRNRHKEKFWQPGYFLGLNKITKEINCITLWMYCYGC